MTLLRIAALLVMAALSTGCLRMTYTLNLKPDGSGTIVQTVGMSKDALASMMGVLAAALEVKDVPAGGTGATPFMTEPELKAAAAAMGTGVRFVSVKPIADDKLEGQTATFAFDDIRQLKFGLLSGFGSLGGPAPAKGFPADADIGVKFERQGAESVLVLTMPEMEDIGAKQEAAKALPPPSVEKLPAVPDVPPEVAKMVQEMFNGFYVEIAVNLEGKIVSTDAPFVDGTKILLMQMDFGELMKTAKGLQEIAGRLDTLPENLEDMFEMPGLKIVTQ